MPHIVIEYSDNLQSHIKGTELMAQSHKIVVDSELFNPDDVKARSICYDDYYMTAGVDNFVHITISILEGRPTDKKHALSKAVFDNAKTLLPMADKVSVDIIDMDKATYQK
jgi:5-carboxymethyl-2-hydroxymuconate isomerase